MMGHVSASREPPSDRLGAARARGGAAAAVTVLLLLVVWSAADGASPGAGMVAARDTSLDLGLAALAGGLVGGVIRWLRRSHTPSGALTVGSIVAALVGVGTLSPGPSLIGWLLVAAVLIAGAVVLGRGVAAILATWRGPAPGPGRRSTAAAGCAAVVTVGLVAWLTIDPSPAATEGTGPPEAATGPSSVAEVTYGPTGADGVDDPELLTDPTDATHLVSGWSDARTSAWGFGPDALPVSARVWYPDDASSAPLVLVAHGNDSARTDSREGFAYLASHLAGHGYVVASIDLGFLGTSSLDRHGGVTGADDAQAWLVLEHLRAWREELADQAPFDGGVDLSNVALIGHSRGADAVLSAATEVDDDAGLDGTTVGAVVALAPAGLAAVDDDAPPIDADLLVLQGTHDLDAGLAEVPAFEAVPTSTSTAAERPSAVSVTLPRANHSQFNERWGRYDLGNGLAKHLIDTATLLPATEQRTWATALTQGFLDASLGEGAGEPATWVSAATAGTEAAVRLRPGSSLVLSSDAGAQTSEVETDSEAPAPTHLLVEVAESEPCDGAIEVDADGREVSFTTEPGDAVSTRVLEASALQATPSARILARTHLIAIPELTEIEATGAVAVGCTNGAELVWAALADLDEVVATDRGTR